MNWLSKFEQEQQQQQQKERAAAAEQARQRQATVVAFHNASARLQPVMEKSIAEIARRTSIQLDLISTLTEISVQAPKKSSFLRRLGSHRFELSSSATEGYVRVAAIEDGRVDRPGEPPPEMSMAEWMGSEEWVFSDTVHVSDLLGGDLDGLFEWLVRTYTSDRSLSAPVLPLHRRRPKPLSTSQLQSRATTALVVSVLGLVACPILVPFGVILGLRSREAMRAANLPAGKATAAVAIGTFITLVWLGYIVAYSIGAIQ